MEQPILKRVSVPLDAEIYDALREEAKRTGRTLPKCIRHALKLYLYILNWVR